MLLLSSFVHLYRLWRRYRSFFFLFTYPIACSPVSANIEEFWRTLTGTHIAHHKCCWNFRLKNKRSPFSSHSIWFIPSLLFSVENTLNPSLFLPPLSLSPSHTPTLCRLYSSRCMWRQANVARYFRRSNLCYTVILFVCVLHELYCICDSHEVNMNGTWVNKARLFASHLPHLRTYASLNSRNWNNKHGIVELLFFRYCDCKSILSLFLSKSLGVYCCVAAVHWLPCRRYKQCAFSILFVWRTQTWLNRNCFQLFDIK